MNAIEIQTEKFDNSLDKSSFEKESRNLPSKKEAGFLP
jgi:hypothetical protein